MTSFARIRLGSGDTFANFDFQNAGPGTDTELSFSYLMDDTGIQKTQTVLTGRRLSQFMRDGQRTTVNRSQMEETAQLPSILRYPDPMHVRPY